jgi:EF hand
MNKLLVALGLGAAMISSGALAQDAGAGGAGGGAGSAMQNMTRAQAQQMADNMFQKLDLNHDGTLTRQEVEQAREQLGIGGERAERMIDRMFGTSQSVSLQQFQLRSLARFDSQDLNHDGTVTATERRQARAARLGQGDPAQ